METLINIKEENGSKVCSARELHTFLEVTTKFTDWCKRMFEYGFIENQDYTLLKIGKRNAHNKTDYALTLDCAKEISMIQRNEKGKQARQYFIEVEKRSKVIQPAIDFSNPDTILELAQNWKKEKDLRVKAENQVNILKPKADLMNKVLKIDKLLTLSEACKTLQLPYGRNTMCKFLRQQGIFFKTKNEPKQSFIERGIFVLKETFIEAQEMVYLQPFVTQKGLEFLNKKLVA